VAIMAQISVPSSPFEIICRKSSVIWAEYLQERNHLGGRRHSKVTDIDDFAIASVRTLGKNELMQTRLELVMTNM
jgi:hypothetical protein